MFFKVTKGLFLFFISLSFIFSCGKAEKAEKLSQTNNLKESENEISKTKIPKTDYYRFALKSLSEHKNKKIYFNYIEDEPKLMGTISSSDFYFDGPTFIPELLSKKIFSLRIGQEKEPRYKDLFLLNKMGMSKYLVFKPYEFKKYLTNHNITIDGDFNEWDPLESLGKDDSNREMYFTFDKENLYWGLKNYSFSTDTSVSLVIYIDYNFENNEENNINATRGIWNAKDNKGRRFPCNIKSLELKEENSFCPDAAIKVRTTGIGPIIELFNLKTKKDSKDKEIQVWEKSKTDIKKLITAEISLDLSNLNSEISINKSLFGEKHKNNKKIKWLSHLFREKKNFSFGFWPMENAPGMGDERELVGNFEENYLGVRDKFFEVSLKPWAILPILKLP